MKVCAANVCGSASSLGSGLITPALLVHSHFHNVATWDEDDDDDEEEEEEEAMFIYFSSHFPPKSFSPAVRFINLVPALHNATTLCKEHKH